MAPGPHGLRRLSTTRTKTITITKQKLVLLPAVGLSWTFCFLAQQFNSNSVTSWKKRWQSKPWHASFISSLDAGACWSMLERCQLMFFLTMAVLLLLLSGHVFFYSRQLTKIILTTIILTLLSEGNLLLIYCWTYYQIFYSLFFCSYTSYC